MREPPRFPPFACAFQLAWLADSLPLTALEEIDLPAFLLVLFPLLLMFNVPAAFGVLGVAIVLLYRGRSASAPQHPTRGRTDDNAV